MTCVLVCTSSAAVAVTQQSGQAAGPTPWHVQVLESRNLALPQEMLHAFFTMDAYIVASVNTEAGTTSLQTKVGLACVRVTALRQVCYEKLG